MYLEQNMSSKLKRELCNKLLLGGYLRAYDVIRHSYTNSILSGKKFIGTIQNTDNNISPTLDTRCDCLGIVEENMNYELSEKMKRYINSYDSGGGYKVSDGSLVINRTIACSKTTREGSSRADTSDFIGANMEENTNVANMDLTQYRIRKLTPRECFRLMGVKDEDFDNVAVNQSNASLYHLAGDSIVVDVLMNIFKQMI